MSSSNRILAEISQITLYFFACKVAKLLSHLFMLSGAIMQHFYEI
jgi:hypothetical protein